ncbi:MAG: hypothetical protein IM613_17110 [Cytophagales bacterium]|nr:hypothetical protein [Cytophagales bacterium]
MSRLSITPVKAAMVISCLLIVALACKKEQGSDRSTEIQMVERQMLLMDSIKKLNEHAMALQSEIRQDQSRLNSDELGQTDKQAIKKHLEALEKQYNECKLREEELKKKLDMLDNTVK